MKKLTCLLLFTLLCVIFVLPASAKGDYPYVVDNAGLLSASEQAALEEKAEQLSEKWSCDLVIVTAPELTSSSAMTMADDFFDYNGYGVGEQRSGTLLLICMDTRDFWISTRGYGAYAFTDYGMEQMDSVYVPYLSTGDYYRAFDAYLSECDRYLAAAEEGTPIDVPPEEPPKALSGPRAFGAAIVAFFSALISGSSEKSKLKSVKRQTGASSYEKKDSLNVSTVRDIFLYRNTTSTPIVRSTSSSGGGHGGSTMHTSSSGASHGGHGGKF